MPVVFPFVIDDQGHKRYIIDLNSTKPPSLILFSADGDRLQLARTLLRRLFGAAPELVAQECAKRMFEELDIFPRLEIEMHQVDFTRIESERAGSLLLLQDDTYMALLRKLAQQKKSITFRMHNKIKEVRVVY